MISTPSMMRRFVDKHFRDSGEPRRPGTCGLVIAGRLGCRSAAPT
jgi:hypothetical protein